MKRPLIFSFFLLFSLFLYGCTSIPDYDGTDGELYTDAREKLELGDYSDAIEAYDFLQSKFPYGVFSEQAWLDKAYAWFLLDRNDTASLELREFLRNYPGHKHSDYAYFLLALLQEASNFSINNEYINDPARTDVSSVAEALRRYKIILEKYPDSPYVAPAKQRIPVLRNRLARHELYVANTYFDRKAWVASINRATNIIDTYPDTVHARYALYLLKDSYLELGLTDVAKDVEKVIEHNADNMPARN